MSARPNVGSLVIDSTWVFAVFGCLAAAALVASQVVRKRDIRRRHEESEALVRRSPLLRRPGDERTTGEVAGDVPSQREVTEERDRQRSRDA